jgi:hypothetical protein
MFDIQIPDSELRSNVQYGRICLDLEILQTPTLFWTKPEKLFSGGKGGRGPNFWSTIFFIQPEKWAGEFEPPPNIWSRNKNLSPIRRSSPQFAAICRNLSQFATICHILPQFAAFDYLITAINC